MICPYCRNENNNDAKFCTKCGNSLIQTQQSSINTYTNVQQNQDIQFTTAQKTNKNTKSNKKIILVLIVVIVLVIAILFCMKVFNNKNNNTNNGSNGSNISQNNNDFSLVIEEKARIYENDVEVEGVITISGRVKSGQVSVGDKMQIIGGNKVLDVVISEISNGKKINTAKTGEYIIITLKNINYDDIDRGQVLTIPGSVNAYTDFKAEIHLLTREEGGREYPLVDGMTQEFNFLSSDIPGILRYEKSYDVIEPGEDGIILVKLDKSVVMNVGDKFTIEDNSYRVATGVVKEIIK